MVSGLFSIPLGAHGAASGNDSSLGEPDRVALRDFISGDENRLAEAAAKAVLQRDTRYNPLLFFGPTGVGKSHLTRGLIASLQRQSPESHSLILDGVDFVRACASVGETDSLADLRLRCRNADTLLFENLEELTDRRHAQRELVGVLDSFMQSRRQMIFTSRCSPPEATWMLEGLRSRLSGGLTVSLKYPGPLARRVIIEQLAQYHEIGIPPEVILSLAEQLSSSVRTINHVVLQLATAAADENIEIDQALADRILLQQRGEQRPTLAKIVTRVSRYYSLKPEELRSPTRRQSVVRARSMAMHLARKLTDASLGRIGQHFGRRDHTTVLHACRKTELLLQTDTATQQAAEELRRQLTLT